MGGAGPHSKSRDNSTSLMSWETWGKPLRRLARLSPALGSLVHPTLHSQRKRLTARTAKDPPAAPPLSKGNASSRIPASPRLTPASLYLKKHVDLFPAKRLASPARLLLRDRRKPLARRGS